MTFPLFTYLKNFFVSKRLIGGGLVPENLSQADVLLQGLIKENKIPGLAVTVLKEGVTIFQKGYGYADLDSKKGVDPRKTIFRIASVSKPIAATALAQMVEDNLINLDASFYKYVPYFPKKQYDFTIRHLAGHTAGIRGYKGKEYGLNKPYSIKESIEIFKDSDLLFKPGTSYHYNSFDWVMVSLAMQEASGLPFDEYVREKVLLPLQLYNTTPEVAGKKYSDAASFYSKNRIGFRKAIPVNNWYKLAGGGFLSTSEDVANFGNVYLQKKVGKEHTWSQFVTSEMVENKPTYYGLGWQVSRDKKGRPFYGHIGNGVGGYSNFFVYPKQQVVFSILVNCTNPEIQQELDEVVDEILSNLMA
ncbi:D-alanyl-D-alanine carboxypeptidase [Sediminicola sp. YIK13]|uniref:serine hydrolase domain-containing protein n=1 Tax=Sediminicola sp. YIK13 TaxID=1453352 RepID=UPI00072179E8|nr:serine hydrolase domain-containing protein [Sediminicola sp. YIK13]ALM09000.1 D-alanyl-D-alanine carboxypeptidase [Sediminicola sp. YIK13]